MSLCGLLVYYFGSALSMFEASVGSCLRRTLVPFRCWQPCILLGLSGVHLLVQ
jgi:hypothetical protein